MFSCKKVYEHGSKHSSRKHSWMTMEVSKNIIDSHVYGLWMTSFVMENSNMVGMLQCKYVNNW